MAEPDVLDEIFANFSRTYGIDISNVRADGLELEQHLSLAAATASVLPNTVLHSAIDKDLALIPDLETVRVSDVSPDDRLSQRLVERNLEQASAYVNRCLQLRSQYAETAKLRNDVRFRGDEFLRLDQVYKQEVEAGLHELPRDEAADEVSGLGSSIAIQRSELARIVEILDPAASGNRYSTLLTEPKMTEFSQNEAFIARNTANDQKNLVDEKARSNANLRIGLDFASWQDRRDSVSSEIAKAESRLSTVQRNHEYLEKDVVFRARRAEISRVLAAMQLNEHRRQNSVINYNERLNQQRQFFNSNLTMAIEYATVASAGLRLIYGAGGELPNPPLGGVLDELALWTLEAEDSLSKYLRSKAVSIYSLWLQASRDALSVDVRFDDIPYQNALLRGVSLEFAGQQPKPISVSVSPPEGAYSGIAGESFTFGAVYPVSSSRNVVPGFSEKFWNGSPEGSWSVAIQAGSQIESVNEVVLHLWLSHD